MPSQPLDATAYSEALDRQLEVWRWLNSVAGMKYMRTVFGVGGQPDPDFSWGREPGGPGVSYPPCAAEIVAEIATSVGQTFYWTPEFSRLLALNIDQFPTTWQLTPQALPAEQGFCWFGAAIPQPTIVDRLGGHIDDDIVAMSWCPIPRLPDFRVDHPGHRIVPPFTAGESLGLTFYGRPAGRVVPMASWTWDADERLETAVKRPGVKLPYPSYETDDYRRNRRLQLFGAALSFMAQRLAVTTRERPGRGTMRRIPRDARVEPVVRVIQLRRREGHPRPAGLTDIEWSCRWLVRGHWRQQFYAVRGEHQTIWIHPYIKGPEDKALKPSRATIFAVVR